MKAVVLDITGREVTVMTRDGDIKGIRDNGYEIGQEIEIDSTGKKSSVGTHRFAPVLSAVAAAAAVLFFAGIRMYFDPYGTVSLDVNPSIEYTINRFDRVLEANGVNEDGSVILSQITRDSLINKDIEDALETTIGQIEAKGYMTDEDGNYIVVSANTRKEEHTDELIERLDNKVKRYGNTRPLSFKVSDEELNEAHDEGISGGRKKIVDSLEEVSGEKLDRSIWIGKSVRDIEEEYDRIKDGQYLKDEKEDRPAENDTVTSYEMQKQTEGMEKPDGEPEDRKEPEGSRNRPENETGSLDDGMEKDDIPKQDKPAYEIMIDENEQGPNDDKVNEERDDAPQYLKPPDPGTGQVEEPKKNADNTVPPPIQNDGGTPAGPENIPPSDGNGSPGGNGDRPPEGFGPGMR